MIQKAIIEELLYDGYQARIRIPRYNKIASSPTATDVQDLAIAIICTLPGVHPAYQVGDIVIVAFENEKINQPVILGLLYRANMGESYSDMTNVTLNNIYLASQKDNVEDESEDSPINLSDVVINSDLNMNTYKVKFNDLLDTLCGSIEGSTNSNQLNVNTDTINFSALSESNQGTSLININKIKGISNFDDKDCAVSREYVDGTEQIITQNGQIQLANHVNYDIQQVDNLELICGEGICAGTIQFNSNTPSITLTGFSHVDGDILDAQPSSFWEFNCWNKNIIFKLYEN